VNHLSVLAGCAVLGLVGCAGSPPIQPASPSKSADGAVAMGTTANVAPGTAGNGPYAEFLPGEPGRFVSMASLRATAQQRAKDFCAGKGRAMQPLAETTSNPPYDVGNQPWIKIVFDCVEKPASQAAPAGNNPK
jgi:hypothetical protein